MEKMRLLRNIHPLEHMMIHDTWFDKQVKRVRQTLLINQRMPGNYNGKPIGKG
jgi:hypothetical protein